MVKLSRTFVFQLVALSFVVSFIAQYGHVMKTLYRQDDDSSFVFVNGEFSLTDILIDYYSQECTYDTPVYFIHERGDTSKFILHSYFIIWTFFKEHTEHNRTYVIFATPNSYFAPSPCESLKDYTKFTNQKNDFDHPLNTVIVPTLRQSFYAFPYFFRPPLYIEKELPPYDVSFHLHSVDHILFMKEIFPMYDNISRDSRSFIAANYFPTLKTMQRSFKNTTTYSFKRKRWGHKVTQDKDYLLDLQSVGDASLMVGKCSSTFFNLAYLYQREFHVPIEKKVMCVDRCDETTTLWLNNNRC